MRQSQSGRLDVHGDVEFTKLASLAGLYGLPDYVREAPKDTTLQLPPGTAAYADVRTPKQFPCHTKAATALSLLFFTENQHEINQTARGYIRQRLEKFAEYWGIAAYWQQLQEKHAQLHGPEEISDGDYALVVIAGDRKERHCPLRNSREVKVAADWFSQNLPRLREQFLYDERRQIAQRILDKSAEMGALLNTADHDVLEKVAGYGLGSPPEISRLLRNRCRAGQHVPAEVASNMQKLADMVDNRPKAMLDTATLHDIATTVDKFDREYGLLNKYSELIPAPEEVIFQVNHRKMSEVQDTSVTLVTGTTLTLSQLEKVSAQDVRDLLGQEIAEHVRCGLGVDLQKLADVATALSPADARLLEDYIADLHTVAG